MNVSQSTGMAQPSYLGLGQRLQGTNEHIILHVGHLFIVTLLQNHRSFSEQGYILKSKD